MSLFVAENLCKHFGGLIAVDHVSLAVGPGEIHALIGPNGAGKTTLVNLISGLLPLDAGRLVLDGVDLTAVSPHQRVRHGLSRCFQITSVFKNDCVYDNLLLAAQAHAGSSFRCFGRRAAESRVARPRAHVGGEGGAQRCPRAASLAPCRTARRSQLDVALALAAQPNCCCSMSHWPAWGRRIHCRWWR
jgi:branched-chain amino acid transport system ATP-binding protein